MLSFFITPCTWTLSDVIMPLFNLQLNIYAKFTDQVNIERSNTFARAVCADELYNIYYSGKNIEFTYIIVASAIVGPVILLIGTILCTCLVVCCRCKLSEENSIKLKTKRKNLVAFVSVGIYISFYILILDIFAVYTAGTSSHEYEPELSVQSRPHAFNVVVAYFTLACDFVFCSSIISILVIIGCIKKPLKKIDECFKKHYSKCHKKGEEVINSVLFPLLLIPPFLCFTSHLGYIILAWITQPSRSTTTLILYYFILFYLYLIFRTSYKHGSKKFFNKESTEENISVKIFTINLFLGMPLYLIIAVVFIIIVYLKPLASEDLFSYLFNVVQFMIVVVSTQYFYKLFAGKSFSIKKTIKTVLNIIEKEKEDNNIDLLSHAKENLDKQTGYLVVELIRPQLPKGVNAIQQEPNISVVNSEQEPNQNGPVAVICEQEPNENENLASVTGDQQEPFNTKQERNENEMVSVTGDQQELDEQEPEQDTPL